MSHVKIRPTDPADLDALADVLLEVHAKDGYPVEGVDDPGAWVDLSDAISQWTAVLDGQPVGHVALMRPAPGDGAARLLVEQDGIPLTQVAVLARLFVAPHARGRQLARSLVGAAEAMAREFGLSLVLEVLLKDVAAINLYRAMGWRTLGRLDHIHGSNQRDEALALGITPEQSLTAHVDDL